MSNLLDQLIKLNQSDEYPLHMPGHKRNMENTYLENAYNIDITEIEGYDNLYEAQGILKAVRERAAALFGAQDTYLLVNGSTVGILTAICALTNKGDQVIMARNCHKAVYHAVELQELQVTYLYPEVSQEWQTAEGIEDSQLARYLQENNKIAAVIITSPTYEGMTSDIKRIATLVHQYQIPLVVDEAHGSHFSFHPRFPKSAVFYGADVVVQSLHKTLPSFTQTALLHVNGDFVQREQIEKYLAFFQTSSPSYLLMAGIDQCLSALEEQGEDLWTDFFHYDDRFIENSGNLKHLRIRPNTNGIDPCKLLISTKRTNISGRDLQKILLDTYHIQIEMAAETYILAIVTQSDTKEGFHRLEKALFEIDEKLSFTEDDIINNDAEVPEIIYSIAESSVKTHKWIKLVDAEGKIVADYVNLYPPGIPLLAPGERISKAMIELLQKYEKKNLHIQGLTGTQKETKIKILEE